MAKQLKDVLGGNLVSGMVNAAKDTAQKAANANTNYSYGSTGSGVKELQQKLINAGYGDIVGNADGVFGAKTQKAVQKYQKDHKLTVDGIAGKNTLGSLNSGISSAAANALNTVANGVVNSAVTAAGGKPDYTNVTGGAAKKDTGNEKPKADAGGAKAAGPADEPATASEPPAETPTTPSNSGFTYGDFTYGDFAGNDDPVVNEAWNVLNQHQSNKPGDYTPVWQDEADAYLNQYQNRDPFSYDFNSDALYQQYKDNYIQQGNMAMMDTMGQAAAMTGGYGNSYAQTAGQQAYNLYMNQLNDIMPELYQMAHDRYTQEGQDMLAMYDLYMNKENYEYNKYQDTLSNWYQEDSRLQSNYDSTYNRAWNEYLEGKNTAYNDYQTGRQEAYNDYWNNINMNYQKERDEVADKQWQATFDENKRQNDIANQQTQQKYYASKYDEEAAAKQQKLVAAGYDIAVDGIWGPESIKAWNDYNAVDDTGLTSSRQEEIETWVMKAIANANGPSFDPKRVIKGSSWLTSDAEREYAYAVVDAMVNMN
jgi:peptidoglycan hydrolase-like protein with peptidoglycan-binding domain